MNIVNNLGVSQLGLIAVLVLAALLGIAVMWRRSHKSGSSLAQRVNILETRVVSMSDVSTLVSDMQSLHSNLPQMTVERVALAFKPRQPRQQGFQVYRVRSPQDPETLARELVDSFKSNVDVVLEMSNVMVEDDGQKWRDPNPEARRKCAAAIKSLARGLDTSFWDQNAHIFTSGTGPTQPLWSRLDSFYRMTRQLKTAVGNLPGTPSAPEFLSVLEQLGALLKTCVAIMDLLK